MTFERVRCMLKKEFIQVFRDPRMRLVVFLIPCFQVVIIGYAVSTDVQHVRTAVYDLDNSQASRDVVRRFADSGYFDIVATADSESAVDRLLDCNTVAVVLRFDHGFAEKINAGRTATLQILLDGADSNTSGIALGYATKIASAYSAQIMLQRMNRMLGASGKLGEIVVRSPAQNRNAPELRGRAWFNENLESRNFYVPGVLVVVVTLTTLVLTSMAIVREKEIGTMEQIMVTPISPTEFILGKTAPFAIIGFIDVILIVLIGVFWFEVPIHGDVFLLFLGTALYLMTTLGIGLLISTVSDTQQQAMISTFFFFFPAMLLSGFAFPIANMPEVVQWLTLLNPMRYFLVVIRGVFLKGVGLDVLWLQLAPLLAMGVATLGLAVRRFHKTLG
jgi:ABC-2 type transport system permease protein